MECAHCHAASPHLLEACSTCREALWCSRECKRAGRKAHKAVCPAAQLAQDDPQVSGAGAGDSTVSARCCDHCGAQPPELLLCSGCDAAFYCTTECQHGAWLGHKKACRAVQKQRKAAQEEEKLTGPACDVCGVQSPEVFKCPACEMAHYCSEEHQRDGWRGHKKTCRQAVQEQAAAATAAAAAAAAAAEPVPAQVALVALPAPVTGQPSATSCGFCGTTSNELLICSQCKVARYCSAAHQKQHWSTHKPECMLIATELSAQTAGDTERAPTKRPALPAPSSTSVAVSCGFCGEAKEKLLLCSKCKMMRYCSAEHQKKHWSTHKLDCTAPLPSKPKALLSEAMHSRNSSIESYVLALRQNKSDQGIVATTVGRLVALLDDDSSKLHFVRVGGLDPLLAALRFYLSNCDLCFLIFCLLGVVASNTHAKVQIMSLGGLDVIITAWRNHPTHADLNHFACQTVANLARNNDNKVTIVARGGLDLLFNVFRNHPSHAEANRCASHALVNLTGNASNDMKIVARGGLDVLFSVLRNHSMHADINNHACHTLANLAAYDVHRALIGARGGLDFVFATIRNLPSAEEVNRQASRALSNLAMNDDNRVAIVARGGLDVLLSLQRNHPAHAEINKFACCTVSHLADYIDNRATIAARGGLDLLFTALRNHPTHAEINYQACHALANLAGDSSNQPTIVARGGLDVLFGVLRNHRTHAKINFYVCGALSNLAASAESHAILATCDGLDLIFTTLRIHPTDADINFVACHALANIATTQSAAIERSGGRQIFQAVKRRFPKHGGIQDLCEQLFDN